MDLLEIPNLVSRNMLKFHSIKIQ